MKQEYYVVFEEDTNNKYKTNLTVVDLNKTLPTGNKEVVAIYIAEYAEEILTTLLGGKKNEIN